MYALITFIVPQLWWVVLISGIVWELYESQQLGCQDFLDIFWDSLGIFIGYSLAKKFKPSSFNRNVSPTIDIVSDSESDNVESIKSESVKSDSVESIKSESVKSESVKSESVKSV
jgi:hypothetical protein